MSRTSKSERVAQIFELPSIGRIPAPQMPLEGIALMKYQELAGNLLKQGKLNGHTITMCEQAGILHYEISRRYKMGRPASVSMMEQMRKITQEIGLVQQSEQRAGNQAKKTNRFARIGVITALHHRA